MAAITAGMVKELREMTGAGMMDCKKALTETDGDMDKAVEYLKEHGQAKAEKKASRIAAEGVSIAFVKDDKTASVVEVNSETDFVAKNEQFQEFVKAVAEQAASTDAKDVDALLQEKWILDSGKTVQEALVEKIATIGENLKIRRFEKVVAEKGCVVTYVHGGGRIGVVVEAETEADPGAVKEALTNIAMQIAAMHPQYVNRSEVSDEYIAKEKETLKAQIMNDPKESQKPEKVINGMVEGRISKELKEICLLDQVYVKAEDGKQTVDAYVKEVAKANSANIAIKRFIRFETGEGIEKKEENFAEEVAKQMQ